jgi:solute carrier family 41
LLIPPLLSIKVENQGLKCASIYIRKVFLFSSVRLVMVASMMAATLSGIFLGSFMCALVVICHKFNRYPDNIIPAVTSCLGDLVNLVLLGFVLRGSSRTLYSNTNVTLLQVIGIFILFSAIACFVFTLKNRHVRPLLKEGWWPLLVAMAISSGTRYVCMSLY